MGILYLCISKKYQNKSQKEYKPPVKPLSSLPSNNNIYNVSHQSHQVVRGNQSGCSGPFDEYKALEILKDYNESMKKEVFWFSFSEEKVIKCNAFISGGTCTAMAIAFIKTYLAQVLYPGEEVTVLPHVSDQGNLGPNLKGGYKLYSSLPKYKEIQAVYNSIEPIVNNNNKVAWWQREKVKVFLHTVGELKKFKRYGLSLNENNIIFLQNFQQAESSLLSSLKKRPSAIYFVRFYKQEKNHKPWEEAHGHSCVLIKLNERNGHALLFYDPNKGASIVSDEELIGHFRGIDGTWDVPNVGIYRIESLSDDNLPDIEVKCTKTEDGNPCFSIGHHGKNFINIIHEKNEEIGI